ncbi:type II secretion system protein GspL [Coralloluteibacterium thermophilus]|uniref:Type II secretion system protein L n=1 Tax=Coralloluteibacterium thermophilum TaxID=2707049 RepID=A0ABV9NQQ7_9GAMM
MSRLVVRLRPASAGSAAPEWEWWPAGRRAEARPGLPPPARDARRTLQVLVPAEDVLLLATPRVGGTARQRARAVPFAIEEQLAAPVEHMHVAWCELDAARLHVAAVERARLRAWLAPLAAAGLAPDSLLPDVLVLPGPAEGAAHVRLDRDRALLRLGPASAYAGAPSEVAAVLAPRARRLDRVVVEADAADAAASAAFVAAAGLDPQRVEHRPPGDDLPPPGAVPDLLQGEFAPPRRRAAAAGAWRWAAALAGAAVLLGVGGLALEREMLAARVAEQRAEMEALYRRAVPQAVRVVDPAMQLRAAADGAERTADPALALLARAAPVLAADGCCTLDAVDYRAGALELTLVAPDLAALDGLRGSLAATGARAELTQATLGTRGVEGRLRLGGAR